MSCDFVIDIVENDAAILDALRLLLATEGYAVRTHQSARRSSIRSNKMNAVAWRRRCTCRKWAAWDFGGAE